MDALVVQDSCPTCRCDGFQTIAWLIIGATWWIVRSIIANGNNGRHSLVDWRLSHVSAWREAAHSNLGLVRANDASCRTPITALLPAALCLGGTTGIACRYWPTQECSWRIVRVRGPPIHNQVLGYNIRARSSIWWHGSFTDWRLSRSWVVVARDGTRRGLTCWQQGGSPGKNMAPSMPKSRACYTSPSGTDKDLVRIVDQYLGKDFIFLTNPVLCNSFAKYGTAIKNVVKKKCLMFSHSERDQSRLLDLPHLRHLDSVNQALHLWQVFLVIVELFSTRYRAQLIFLMETRGSNHVFAHSRDGKILKRLGGRRSRMPSTNVEHTIWDVTACVQSPNACQA